MRQLAECDRNGCVKVATQLLKWESVHATPTKACDKHALWWKRGSRQVVLVSPLVSR